MKIFCTNDEKIWLRIHPKTGQETGELIQSMSFDSLLLAAPTPHIRGRFVQLVQGNVRVLVLEHGRDAIELHCKSLGEPEKGQPEIYKLNADSRELSYAAYCLLNGHNYDGRERLEREKAFVQ